MSNPYLVVAEASSSKATSNCSTPDRGFAERARGPATEAMVDSVRVTLTADHGKIFVDAVAARSLLAGSQAPRWVDTSPKPKFLLRRLQRELGQLGKRWMRSASRTGSAGWKSSCRILRWL